MNTDTKTILVTGGAGFIGSNFILYMMNTYNHIRIINLDNLSYAGNLANLQSIENHPHYTFIKGDITDRNLIEGIFSGHEDGVEAVPDMVINFAAETHVDRSIKDSAPFVNTNIMGTQTLLDLSLKYLADKPDFKFIQISTDEVYGSLSEEGFFTESHPLQPNSPYSASKAGADLLVRSYYKTHKLPVMITRCSNNYGPYQFPEKLIPLTINNILSRQSIPVYGNGMNIRDWLFVEDHCRAIDRVSQAGLAGQVYNIGGHNEMTNINLVRLLCQLVDQEMNWQQNSEELITFVTDRPGHDQRYAIDAYKIENELGWTPTHNVEDGMKKTILWYLKNQNWLAQVTDGSYKDYYKQMYGER